MSKGSFFSSRVLKIIMFINKNFANSTSLHEISFQTANLSLSHAERIFKDEVGVSLKKFLILKRLYEAAILLRSDLKLSELDVVSRCGFNDVSNFIKQFRKFFGCTPVRFRHCSRNPEGCVFRKKSRFSLLNSAKLREALEIEVSQPCLLLRIKKTNK